MMDERAKLPHAYVGTLKACKLCYRPKEYQLHIANVVDALEVTIGATAPIAPISTRPDPPKVQPHSHTCTVCGRVTNCVTEDEVLTCDIKYTYHVCGKCIHLSPQDKEYASWAQYATNIGEPTTLCAGHTCPKCGNSWNHTYHCGKDKNYKPLCEDCARQSNRIINRPSDIEQIAQTSGSNLTAQEYKEKELRADSTCWELCHDPISRKLLPNFQELMNNHRRDIKRKIELLRIDEIRASKNAVEFDLEARNTLTPEEREQYERDARRGKTVNGRLAKSGKSDKSSKSDKSDKSMSDNSAGDSATVARKKFFAGLLADIKLRKPSLSETELVKLAEKRLKDMQEDDSI